MFKNYFNGLLSVFGLQLNRKDALVKERDYLDSKFKGCVDIFKVHFNQKNELNQDMECMIFSMDRTMQLSALLRSYFDNVIHFCPLVILYKATNEKSIKGYESLKNEFADYPVRFENETDFRLQVIQWLENSRADRVFFMTDDAIFLDGFDLNDALFFNPLKTILSLTKGFDKTFCFPLNKIQKVPSFQAILNPGGTKFNLWHWNDEPDSPDWSYPLSVDGNIFHRIEILSLLKNIGFFNPNTLEANMQIFLELFAFREGVCYDKAKLVNVPCNIVQNVYKNNTTGHYSTEELQGLWDEGIRIDTSEFYGMSADEACLKKFLFLKTTNN